MIKFNKKLKMKRCGWLMKASISTKIIGICLVICILFSFFPSKVLAVTSGDYSYSEYVDGRVSIQNYTGNESIITLPTELDGNTITIVSNLIKDNSTVKKVIIPEGIKEIYTYAFKDCPNLTEIVIPSTITNIQKNFVYNCPQAKYIMPDTIKQLDDGSYRKVVNVTINGEYDYDTALEIVNLTNKYRVEKGLEKLEVDNELMEYAMQRSAELATFCEHKRPYGGEVFSENLGVAGAQMATASFAVNAWINSPGHEKQMVDPEHKSIGVGFFTSNGISYYIQCFKGKESSNSNTKHGTEIVIDKIIPMDPSTDHIKLIFTGLNDTNTLSIGDTLSPKTVLLENQGNKGIRLNSY